MDIEKNEKFVRIAKSIVADEWMPNKKKWMELDEGNGNELSDHIEIRGFGNIDLHELMSGLQSLEQVKINLGSVKNGLDNLLKMIEKAVDGIASSQVVTFLGGVESMDFINASLHLYVEATDEVYKDAYEHYQALVAKGMGELDAQNEAYMTANDRVEAEVNKIQESLLHFDNKES